MVCSFLLDLVPGVEVVRVIVVGDVQGDVDIEARARARSLTNVAEVSLVQIWPPVTLLMSSNQLLLIVPRV